MADEISVGKTYHVDNGSTYVFVHKIHELEPEDGLIMDLSMHLKHNNEILDIMPLVKVKYESLQRWLEFPIMRS